MEKKNYEREKTQDSRGRKKPYEKKAYEKEIKEGNGKPYHTPKNAYGGKPYRNEKERAGDRERYPKRDRSSANRFASKLIDDAGRYENTEQYTDTSMAQMPEKIDTPYTVTEDELAETDTGLVVGRNAVRELLRSGRPVDKLYVSGREGSITALVAEAKKRGIPVVDAETQKLDLLANGEHHQGIIAQAAAKEYVTIADLLQIAQDRGEMPLIVVCDGVEDPHNLGAIIRAAECCGAHGVIIPKRRACGLTAAVSKASAGAVEHMAVARVQNIAGAIEELKKAGVWTFAAEADGNDFWTSDFRIPCAIVLGSEGDGVSRLVRERCDFLVSIPMYGEVNSLNVSTAASILLCHAARMQRMPK